MTKDIPRYPSSLSEKELYPLAYYYMFLSRKTEEKIIELFKKGYAKGTVTTSKGNEATAVGMGLPFRPKQDVLSILHRDFPTHLLMGSTPFQLLCQYIATADSPTHGREGNAHHGNAKERRLPMISHLGNMLALVVGGVWAARRNNEDVFGLAVIGDGGSSTGDFHESLNIASVRRVPVLFMIENNNYAYSTPTRNQFHCKRLSDRAKGYGIPGKSINGTDVWEVYCAVNEAIEEMNKTSLPYLIESLTLRLDGHAAYDKAEYVSEQEKEEWLKHEPLENTRTKLAQVSGFCEEEITAIEKNALEELNRATEKALGSARPNPSSHQIHVYACSETTKVKPFKASDMRNQTAVTAALDFILAENPRAFLLGQDIGRYGSAFKTCKGLFEKFGPDRVMDMPICESATVGFALGATQTGGKPIVEFQFADFATEAVTQIGLNSGTWYFRSGRPAPMLLRFPCGGGITLGAFHSGEFDGLWSRFPGLKILYPYTPQEVFEAIVAGFYDPNPCLVFEHKRIYWGKQGNIDFNGELESVWRPRQYTEGDDITVISTGAINDSLLSASLESKYSIEVWNPFILQPLCLEPIEKSVRKTRRLLVVQESGHTAGMGDRFISLITRKLFSELKCAPGLVSAPDTPLPFAPELEKDYLPGVEKIGNAIEKMMGDA